MIYVVRHSNHGRTDKELINAMEPTALMHIEFDTPRGKFRISQLPIGIQISVDGQLAITPIAMNSIVLTESLFGSNTE